MPTRAYDIVLSLLIEILSGIFNSSVSRSVNETPGTTAGEILLPRTHVCCGHCQ